MSKTKNVNNKKCYPKLIYLSEKNQNDAAAFIGGN